MDMLPSKYIRVSYFWPKCAKRSFCVWRVSKKLKKIEKKIEKILKFFFFTKSILSIIYELCQNLGYLRSLWKAQETKTLGGALSAPPPYKVWLISINADWSAYHFTISNPAYWPPAYELWDTRDLRDRRYLRYLRNQKVKEIWDSIDLIEKRFKSDSERL